MTRQEIDFKEITIVATNAITHQSKEIKFEEITSDDVEYLQLDISNLPTDKYGFFNPNEMYLSFIRKTDDKIKSIDELTNIRKTDERTKSINDVINCPKVKDKIINIPK